jgi:hypothetical protein
MAHGNAISRFTDADKEPAQTLTPIEGYEKKPLVSLKEAVASIDTPIHNINGMVWTAERNCDKPSDNLSSDESASIHLYTMEWPEDQDSFYTLLNRKLRSEKRNELRSWYLYLKLFFTALYKLPSLKSIVWRGIRGDATHLYRKDFIWWGVSSCTDSLEVVEKFVGRSGVRTLFMIDCLNGKAIKPHSFYKDENEILLMPGTYLRVIDKCSPADDLHIIRLREETPPYQLLASPINSSTISSSVDINLVEKLTISSSSQPKNQGASAKSHGTWFFIFLEIIINGTVNVRKCLTVRVSTYSYINPIE